MRRIIFIALISLGMVSLVSVIPAADRDEWHLEYELKQRVSLCESLNRSSPRENVKEYFAYAAIPPVLSNL